MIDPIKLTAYALNELPPADRAAVESDLPNDPAAQAALTEIQTTAALLSAQLAAELSTELATEPQALPKATSLKLKPAPRPRHPWATAAIALSALAAAAAVTAGIKLYVNSIATPVSVASVTKNSEVDIGSRPASTYIQRLEINPPDGTPQGNISAGKNPAASSAARAVSAIPPNVPFRIAAQPSAPVDELDSVVLPIPKHDDQAQKAVEPLPTIESETDARFKSNREQTIAGLIQDARQNYDEGKYTESLVKIDNIQKLDPTNAYAADVRQMVEDKASNQTQRRAGFQDPEYTRVLNDQIEASRDLYTGIAGDSGTTNIVTGNVSGLNYYHGASSNAADDLTKLPSRYAGETESYTTITDNSFLSPQHAPLSTFAVDVDTASYANIRRFIEQGQLPPADAVRIEDLINYFPYSTPGPKPTDADPVAVHVELADCPWQPAHRLARIALKAKTLTDQKRPPSNLVFLLDVSGSMADENKLPLLKQAMKKLVNKLTPTDRVSIITYAGNAQTALAATSCSDEAAGNTTPRQQILDAIDSLNADGETNGGDGIQLAYKTAVSGFIKEGVNRVILATDGDFNVGVTDPAQLDMLIDKEASTGVYLTVLGLGMGNVKDSTMEQLAAHGKGNYAYLDSVEEADKVLGRQINSTLVTVAKDVKIQVEFNPAMVSSYRLIGYENRALPNKDFNNDQKTGGEMGAGHSVTALYEVIPTDQADRAQQPLKYQPKSLPSTNPANRELMTVSVRYQPPQGGQSKKLEVPVTDDPEQSINTSNDFRFTAAVALFGMILRNSPYIAQDGPAQGTGDHTAPNPGTINQVIEQASGATGEDPGNYRAQFVELARRAKGLISK
jgi:Ca-activated chloride channel family protein